MERKQIIKQNWKNSVRFNFTGKTLTDLKQFTKIEIEKAANHYNEWETRRSPEFRDKITNLLY